MLPVTCLLAVLSLSALTVPAVAHDGVSTVATSWDGGILPLFAILLGAFSYGAAILRLRSQGSRNSFLGGGRVVTTIGGLLALGVALLPPLEPLAHRMLAAHMAQHLLLMLVAAPLLIWGCPARAVISALPRDTRQNLANFWVSSHLRLLRRVLRRPATAWVAFCGAIAIWHLPAVHHWALEYASLHIVMHVTFLGSGLLFWSAVLEPVGRRRLDYGRAILFVFVTALVTGLPGALLSFARQPIYADLAAEIRPWGLSPLEDQQLAGLLMWIPMDLLLFGVAGALFVAWLNAAERRRPLRNPAGLAIVVIPLLVLLSGCSRSDGADSDAAMRGASLIENYGCGTCHVIPGIAGARGLVGPPLSAMARRTFIAGVLSNSTDHMATWVQDPQSVVPGNAMPNMGISDQDARDIAAYISTLD